MHLLCPTCRNPMELACQTLPDEVLCPSCGSSIRLLAGSTQAALPPQAPRRLGRFEVLEQVGVGAFGTVYRALDPGLDRVVAIKVPRAGALGDNGEAERFLREARSIAQLRHGSIVSVYEAGEHEGTPFLVSEFVRGVTLADRLSAGRPGPRESAVWAAAVADALQYAHEQGVVHRDVKPSNVMLDEGGRPVLMDFGLARREGAEATLTLAGQVLGTPAYMAPEQARGDSHKVDGRSDVYSLGVVLYEMLAGRLPFQGTSRMIMYQVQHEEPPPPRGIERSVPRDLETVCLKALAKEPARRYQTARDMAADLRRFLAGEPVRAVRPGVLERSLRWARRHKAAMWGLAGSFLSLCVGVVLAVIVLRPAKGPAETPEPPPPGLPADLALVPPDAYGFIAVDLAAFRGPAGQGLNPKAAEQLRKFLISSEESIGLAPEQIGRVVLFLCRGGEGGKLSELLVAVTTVTPYDRDRVLRAILPAHAEGRAGGATLYVLKRPTGAGQRARPLPGDALHFVDERTFLCGPEAEVARILTLPRGAGAEGPWADALKLATKRLVVAGFYPPDVLDQWVAGGRLKDDATLSPLLGARAAVLTLDRDGEGKTRLELHVDFPPQSLGSVNESAVGAALAALAGKIDSFLGTLKVLGQKLPPAVRWVESFSAELKKPELGRRGSTIQATVRVGTEPAALFAILAGAVTNVQEAAQLLQHANNMKQLVTALLSHAGREGRLPSPAIYDPAGRPLLSWRVALLPYLGREALYKEFRLDEPWDSPHNVRLLPRMPKVFAAPGTEETSSTHYRVFVGKGTAFEPPGVPESPPGESGVRLGDFPDGRANTLLIAQAVEAVPWTKPDELEYGAAGPLPRLGGTSAQGFYAALADGSVPLIPHVVAEKVLRGLITRNGGEAVRLP